MKQLLGPAEVSDGSAGFRPTSADGDGGAAARAAPSVPFVTMTDLGRWAASFPWGGTINWGDVPTTGALLAAVVAAVYARNGWRAQQEQLDLARDALAHEKQMRAREVEIAKEELRLAKSAATREMLAQMREADKARAADLAAERGRALRSQRALRGLIVRFGGLAEDQWSVFDVVNGSQSMVRRVALLRDDTLGDWEAALLTVKPLAELAPGANHGPKVVGMADEVVLTFVDDEDRRWWLKPGMSSPVMSPEEALAWQADQKAGRSA